jgi:protein O-GlcNAc transferase
MQLTVDQMLKQGLAAHNQGNLQEAEHLYRAILQVQPKHPHANHNLGLIAVAINQSDVALLLFKNAIEVSPNIEQFWLSYIEALISEQQFEGAKQALKNGKKKGVAKKNLKILRQKLASVKEGSIPIQDPYHAESQKLINHYENDEYGDAEQLATSIIEKSPDHLWSWKILGSVFAETGRVNESLVANQNAARLDTEDPIIHYNVGTAMKQLGRFIEAEESFKRALALDSTLVEAHINLGVTLKDLGRVEEAEASYRQAMASGTGSNDAHGNLLFLYAGFNYEASLYLKEARDYGFRISETVTSRFSSWSCKEEHQALRVGFVSGDLCNHPVGYFLEGLLNELSRSKLELFAYPTKLLEDELTLRIKPHFTAWQPLVSISDKEAANLIHSDGIHILIDLSGHTARNRLPIFAWKPAPVQITWLGYFASTGIAEIDYILGDSYVTPAEEADHYIEKVWRLPESYLCFTEPIINVEVGPLHALSTGSVTFGCFSKIERMNDNVVAVWARVLKAIPDSRLFLKDKKLSESAMRRSVFSRFERVGIEKNQLILEGRSSRSEYLAAYNRVDISLSPFPYGGGTTSAEGLWMGVPIIVKRGNHFLSHLGESIAHNAGLSNWIASDEDEYVAKAMEFSSNLDDLAALRSRLRAQVVSSPLFDAERFANHFENALRGMWERWCGHF